MPQSALPTFHGLDNVVVAGGTPAQWAEMSTTDWNQRLDALAAGVKSSGAHWVTLLPHHGPELSAKAAGKFSEKLLSTSKVVLEDVGHSAVQLGPGLQLANAHPLSDERGGAHVSQPSPPLRYTRLWLEQEL